jgi:Fic family protein
MLGERPRYETVEILGDTCEAYVPAALPPDPYPVTTATQAVLLEETAAAIGRLDGLGAALPDTSYLVYAYVRKEAVLSSQIEGSQSSLSDLLLFEIEETPGAPVDDVREVSNYVKALAQGKQSLDSDASFSLDLIQRMHATLLSSGRGSTKGPGRFRTESTWVGGSRPRNAVFVPPPNALVPRLMEELLSYINEAPGRERPLVRAALAHVQFETIHPFLDGNGRIGRLLIPLMLYREKRLFEPLLYSSLYFKTHRQEYYQRLQDVRSAGGWSAWVEFFAQGLREAARSAAETAHRLTKLFERDSNTIQRALGRKAGSGLRVLEALKLQPIVATAYVVERTGLSLPTVIDTLRRLTEVGICRELTGGERHLRFVYSDYLDVLSEDTDV